MTHTRLRMRFWRWLGGGAVATGLCLTACQKENTLAVTPAKEVKRSQFKVCGKVTYKGTPVPFGHVLFYNLQSTDTTTGQMPAPSFGIIQDDGSYEVSGPRVGPCQIAVVTDPDIELSSLIKPTTLGGAPGKPGAVGPPGGGPPGGRGGPPGVNGPPGGVAAPVRPAPPGRPGGGKPPVHRDAEKLTDAQKKTLKEIHKQYGTVGTNALVFVVAGESDQTFDIELPTKGSRPK